MYCKLVKRKTKSSTANVKSHLAGEVGFFRCLRFAIVAKTVSEYRSPKYTVKKRTKLQQEIRGNTLWPKGFGHFA